MRKLGVARRTEAVYVASKIGLLWRAEAAEITPLWRHAPGIFTDIF
jgi:hypothetical protein